VTARLSAATFGLVGLIGCGGGGGGGDPGSVTLLSANCPSGVGNLPNTSCLLLRVESSGNPPATVEVRVTEADANVPYVGSVLLCTGLDGSTFFAHNPGGEELIGDLTAIGLRVMDRAWEDGWLGSGTGVKTQSARLAKLLVWLLANEHLGGLFFAVGNSGGGGEIAYSLTTWGQADLFDGVVLASGPPFTRLDYLCLPPDGTWGALCPGLVPPLACGGPPCTAPPGNPVCIGIPPNAPAAELIEQSLLHGGAVTDFGALSLHFLIGDDDCSEWIPQAFLFEAAITSPHTLEIVPATPHIISATPQGRAAVVQALLGFAASPPEPVSEPAGFSLTLIEDGEPRILLRSPPSD
jgi:hypothetical protein